MRKFDGQSASDPQETNFDGRELDAQPAAASHEMRNHQSVSALYQKGGCDVVKESGDQRDTRNLKGEGHKFDDDIIKVRLFCPTFANGRSMIKEHSIQRNANVV